MTFVRRRKRVPVPVASSEVARHGPLARRVTLPNGDTMLVMRQSVLQAALKAGQDSLRRSRLALVPDRERRGLIPS